MKRLLTGTASLGLLMLVLAGCAPSDGGVFDATREINLVTRESGSGTRGAFIELFGLEEKKEDGSRKDLITKEAGVENNTNTILTTVQNDRYAISYCSMGSLNDNIKTLKIEGADATAAHVKDGTYPIKRPFHIAALGEPDGLKKDFIDYILSEEGQEITTATGFIAVDDGAAAYAGDMPGGRLVVGGSSSVAPLMEKLIEGYRAVNPGADVQMQTSDSSIGMSKTMEGVYDIGMASRALKDSEKAALTEIQIALDGIAVIVNKANTLDGATTEEIKKIYLGEIKTWDQIET